MNNLKNHRRTVLPIGALLLLAGCSSQSSSSFPGAGTTPKSLVKQTSYLVGEPVWGAVNASGLQMGLLRPANTPAFYCVIRNQSQRKSRYNPYWLGYFETVSIWARPIGTKAWQKIPRRKASRLYKGVGPLPEWDKDLLPGQKILPFANPEQYQKSPLAQSPIIRSSFSDSLWDFTWPARWTGEIELYVEQSSISYDTKGVLRSLHSGSIIIPKQALVTPSKRI